MEAMFGRKYWRASWTCIVINIFNQFSGIGPVIMFAGQLVKSINEEEGDFPLTPTQGAVVVGVDCCLGTIGAYFLV